MRHVAREMNLSETSFVAPLGSGDFSTASSFELRWFTPTTEVALCGHGTLAAAKAIFQEKGNGQVISQQIKKPPKHIARRKAKLKLF